MSRATVALVIKRSGAMTPKHLYLLLAVIGFIAPYYFFISFLLRFGPDGRIFLQQLFATNVSTFFAIDLLLASVVFLLFMWQEAKRYAMSDTWLYVLALFIVGLSFALPLFLYVRQFRLDARLARPPARSIESHA
jgi:NADH:ubiquinone oxidoreductase subunit 2 (subunit N)